MAQPQITIALNSYRNAPMLKLCIESILETCADLDYELIVADSATEDDTCDLMRQEFGDIKFIPDERNIGFGAMVNKCIKEAQGKYIFILNADVIMEAGTVAALRDYLIANSKVGIVSPAQKNFNGDIAQTCFRFYRPMTVIYRRTPLGKLPFAKKHLDWFAMNDRDLTKIQEVDWTIGSAMMMEMTKVRKIGIFDPIFFMYMEDVDWCRRFWAAGYSVVFNPTVTLYHYYGKGSAKGGILYSLFFNRLTRIHIQSAFKYFRKYWGKPNPRKDSK